MRFGLFGGASAPRVPDAASTAESFLDFVETNVEAEALGYHSSFVTEHHFTGIGQLSAPLTLLTFIAARTTRLRLGTAILVLPWHNPVLLAEQVATLICSRAAGSISASARATATTSSRASPCRPTRPSRASRRCSMCSCARSPRTTPFSHRGRFFRFDDIVVEPPPHQRPHPPLWLAAGSDALDHGLRAARLQSPARPVRLAAADRRTHRALPARA